jgi:NAD(P)-dependent dehydrogenase (short-subunit alcohol dehydrogenase family)
MLKGKTAIVTGGGRGIGAATAELLASHGARVMLASRTESEIRNIASVIANSGWCPTDVSSESQVTSLFNQTLERMGPVDILVNCAAVLSSESVESLSLDAWNEIQAINITGTFLCCREAFRQMKGRGGAIVNVSSLGGVQGTEKFPGYSAYTTSKYAVIGLTESLAVEARSQNIRVNCVAPGAVDTQMLKKAAPELKTKTSPLDIANIILFLCDESRSASLNGTVIPVHSNL